jgi:hypothetical protein
VSIDGRHLVTGPARGLVLPPPPEERAPVLTALAWLVVAGPLVLVAALAYLIGTWAGGGATGGLLSLLSTAGLAGFMWMARRRRG